MNTLKLLRGHQHEAEVEAAVWVDDHNLLRQVAGFLAHHRLVRAVVLTLAAPILALPAAIWAAREAGRIVDRAHEVSGEDGKFCGACTNEVFKAEARVLRDADGFAYDDFIALCELADGGLS